MIINIGTFNIQHGKNYPHYLRTNEEIIDLESCVAQIRETGLDICGLNEVYNECNCGKPSQAEVIGKALGYHYHFARAIDLDFGEYGNALVSRFPIKSVETFPIELDLCERIGLIDYETRVLLHAVLDVDGTELSVYACHFGLSEKEQKEAELIVTENIKNDDRPVVLMGDFNITPDNPIIGNLSKMLFNTSSLVQGNTLTFPSDVPEKCIDYIFVNDKLKTLSAHVPDVSCSDHREYTATVEL